MCTPNCHQAAACTLLYSSMYEVADRCHDQSRLMFCCDSSCHFDLSTLQRQQFLCSNIGMCRIECAEYTLIHPALVALTSTQTSGCHGSILSSCQRPYLCLKCFIISPVCYLAYLCLRCSLITPEDFGSPEGLQGSVKGRIEGTSVHASKAVAIAILGICKYAAMSPQGAQT